MKIVFVLTVHKPDDDRVWYLQANTLREAGHEVYIVSARMKRSDSQNVYCFDNETDFTTRKLMIAKFEEFLEQIHPDAIICDNPVSVLAARNYKKKSKRKSVKIYYDITEFYPSKIHLHHTNFIKNLLKYCLLYCISIYIGFWVDGFIFGEYYKAKRYKRIFFWKKSVYLTYYASLEHVKNFPTNNIQQKCSFFYAGNLTEKSGFLNVVNAVVACAQHFADINFMLYVISKDTDFQTPNLKQENLKIEINAFMSFPEFCQTFGKCDIFFDLRPTDIENTRCLPIKLFYYMAAGRPVVYSNLKAIRKGVPEINEFGFLVNPQNIDEIVGVISQYIESKELYQKHCAAARELAETKYNWENIKNQFIEFIEKQA